MDLGIRPTQAVEFGCGQGFNIAEVVHTFNCRGLGIDPSGVAIAEARRQYSPGISFLSGTASYRFLLREYDLVMYGFCLYLSDRENLSNIVSVGDQLLNDGGYLVIQDFDPEYPHKVPYHHHDGIFSYKMDYSKLWLANPAYSLVQKNVYAEGEAVWVLKKDVAAGWPEQAAP
jgi:SAM-dependent methyltransferase